MPDFEEWKNEIVFPFLWQWGLAVSMNSWRNPRRGSQPKQGLSRPGIRFRACTIRVYYDRGKLVGKAKGIVSVKVDFSSKNAVIEFDEHRFQPKGRRGHLRYAAYDGKKHAVWGSTLFGRGRCPETRPLRTKAAAALVKVRVVAKVTPFPQQEAVAISVG